ncbi:MAG: hypothetical protein MJ152_04855, partial [Clostridia bacterium]|nr:hypothetical protein [Clostridia bacterium]
MVVINLIVDDGNTNRSNRKILFNDIYQKIGAGNAPHNTFKSVTVLMYATNFLSYVGGYKVPHTYTTKKVYKTGNNDGFVKTTTVETRYEVPQQEINPVYQQPKQVIQETYEQPTYQAYQPAPQQNIPQQNIPQQNITQQNEKTTKTTTQTTYGPNGEKIVTTTKETTYKQQDVNVNQYPSQTINQNFQTQNQPIPGTQPQSEEIDPNVLKAQKAAQGKDPTKVSGGGYILNTNVESSGWTPSLQDSDYVKMRKRAEEMDKANAKKILISSDTK